MSFILREMCKIDHSYVFFFFCKIKLCDVSVS